MDTYRWQHNNAVVTRLYYSERMVQCLIGAAATATIFDSFFIYKNYFAASARARIPKVRLRIFNYFSIGHMPLF